jgi:hypothetical protein
MTLKRPALETLALATLSCLASFLILDRWTVTKLGPLSFGRVWQLYINYFDFGFVRRGLVGTIVHSTHLSSLFANEYYFAIFVQHVAIFALAALTAVYFLRSKTESGALFKAVVFLSPTFILQCSYTTGSLDVFVLSIVILNILFVRNVILFSVLLALGIFVHELFAFTIPAQLAAFYIRNDLDLFSRFADTLKRLALPVAATAAAILVIVLFGQTHMPRGQYEAMMAAMIPHAVGKMDLWSGYFEVGSSVDDNSRSALFLGRHLLDNLIYVIIPAAYVALLVFVLSRREADVFRRVLLVAGAAAPLVAYLVASDFFRWLGLSGNLALLLLVYYVHERGATVRRGWLVALLCFSVLAPFGGAVIQNPFPAHKFILNRFLR